MNAHGLEFTKRRRKEDALEVVSRHIYRYAEKHGGLNLLVAKKAQNTENTEIALKKVDTKAYIDAYNNITLDSFKRKELVSYMVAHGLEFTKERRYWNADGFQTTITSGKKDALEAVAEHIKGYLAEKHKKANSGFNVLC